MLTTKVFSLQNTSSTVDLKATAMHDEFIKNVSAIPMLSYEDLQVCVPCLLCLENEHHIN